MKVTSLDDPSTGFTFLRFHRVDLTLLGETDSMRGNNWPKLTTPTLYQHQYHWLQAKHVAIVVDNTTTTRGELFQRQTYDTNIVYSICITTTFASKQLHRHDPSIEMTRCWLCLHETKHHQHGSYRGKTQWLGRLMILLRCQTWCYAAAETAPTPEPRLLPFRGSARSLPGLRGRSIISRYIHTRGVSSRCSRRQLV